MNVSVALITSQARNKHVVGTPDGRLFFVASDDGAAQELFRLATAGRYFEPFAVASLGKATVKGRFAGGRPLGNQAQNLITPTNALAPSWFQSPRVEESAFEFNNGLVSPPPPPTHTHTHTRRTFKKIDTTGCFVCSSRHWNWVCVASERCQWSVVAPTLSLASITHIGNNARSGGLG